MRNAFVSWRSTLSGWAACAAVLAADWYSGTPHAFHMPVVLLGLGLAGVGTTAKDAGVTGGTILNSQATPRVDLPGQPDNPVKDK